MTFSIGATVSLPMFNHMSHALELYEATWFKFYLQKR